MTINIVLLRHGQSYTNSGKIVHKDTQNLLTPKGVKETLRHADGFRKVFPELHFDHVFVSPLFRAQQTAFNFLSQFDNQAIDAEIVDGFRERSFGFDGFLTIEDMIAQYGADTIDSWEFDVNARPGDNRGETLQEVYDRVTETYRDKVLPRILDGQKILVVSHYYVMKCLQSFLQFNSIQMAPIFEPKNSLPVPYSFPVKLEDMKI